jgi:hypothetical protein
MRVIQIKMRNANYYLSIPTMALIYCGHLRYSTLFKGTVSPNSTCNAPLSLLLHVLLFYAYALFPSKPHVFCTLLHNRSSSQPILSAFSGCCYITVDFATAASLNGVCMCHSRTLLFHDCSMTTDETYEKNLIFCNFLKNIGFLAKR